MHVYTLVGLKSDPIGFLNRIIRLIVALIVHVYVKSDWNLILRSAHARDAREPEVEGH